jgi:hypothetical protein
MTTVKGNQFHFRGGDPQKMAESLRRVFMERLGREPVRARVEP